MSKQGYNGNYRQRYKDESIKTQKLSNQLNINKEAIKEQLELIGQLRSEITRITTDLALERDQNRKDKGYKFGFYAMAIINAVIIIGVNL